MDIEKLSKTVAHALRHAPQDYRLALDAEGWADLETLLQALRQRSPDWELLDEQDLRDLLEASRKKRFQIKDGRIRATHGHSTPDLIHKEAAAPPDTLYHGTTRKTAERILTTGLKPMGRQYVHLSQTVEEATLVGQRRDGEPAILAVDAKAAHAAGLRFYRASDNIWLADQIPVKYLTLKERRKP